MHQKLVILLFVVVSATCTVLHQPIPVFYGLDYQQTPNYNFAYEVNDAHTGDIKTQNELRRGDAVRGQYSLVQPDGIVRTVDYSANDHTGFQATVNNNGRPDVNADVSHQNFGVHAIHPYPTPTISSTTQAPVSISRTSIVQSFPNTHVIHPWI